MPYVDTQRDSNFVHSVPPETLTAEMAEEAWNQVASTDGDLALRAIEEHGDHSRGAFIFKATGIVQLANVPYLRVVGLGSIYDRITAWSAEEDGMNLAELVNGGLPEDVDRLCVSLKQFLGNAYLSFLSKYLAYHRPDRWPIYDSWVRGYIWAYALSFDQYCDNPTEPGHFGFEHVDDLKVYSTYCYALEQLWSQIGLPATFSKRQKDAVLWWRARTPGVHVSRTPAINADRLTRSQGRLRPPLADD